MEFYRMKKYCLGDRDKIISKLLEQASKELGRFTIPISNVFPSDNNILEGGSATFVKIRDKVGYLTTNHNICSKVIDKKTMYVPTKLEKRDPTIFYFDEVSIKKIYSFTNPKQQKRQFWAQWLEKDLDLAFVEINSDEIRKILDRTGKKILDLDLEREKYIKSPSKYWSPDSANNWIWGVCGVPREAPLKKDGYTELPFAGVFLGGGETKYCQVIDPRWNIERCR